MQLTGLKFNCWTPDFSYFTVNKFILYSGQYLVPIQFNSEKTSDQESLLLSHMWIYLPGLGSTEAEGTAGGVVFGLGLHTAGIAAVVGLRQAKATQNFSSSCMTK